MNKWHVDLFPEGWEPNWLQRLLLRWLIGAKWIKSEPNTPFDWSKQP